MNKRYFIRIFPLIVLFAGSCTVGPKFKAPVVETPPRYMGAAGTAATDLYWWQLFDDTTLTRLIATAIENNRNVEIAFSRVEQARLTLKETRAGLWPSVSYGVTGQYGTESFIGLKSDKPVETYIIKPSISWELDLFGKIRRMSEADRAQLLATDRAAQGVLVSLVAEVASTYFSYLQYEYAGKTARQTSISREATYALQQQSYAIGSIDELQLRQGEAAYATAAAANAQYERASEQALHALSLLLGQNPSQVVGKHTPLVDLRIPAEVPAGLPSDLLARRPDMVEAYYQVMAANAQIGVAQAMRFPSIALTGNGGVFSEEFKKLFDHMYRLIFFPFCVRIQVYIFKHKFPQIFYRPFRFRRHFNNRLIHTVRDHIMHQSIKPLFTRTSKSLPQIRRNIILCQNSSSYCIIHIVVDICKLIGNADNLPFQSMRMS